jgi:hypothetical protein
MKHKDDLLWLEQLKRNLLNYQIHNDFMWTSTVAGKGLSMRDRHRSQGGRQAAVSSSVEQTEPGRLCDQGDVSADKAG